MKRIVDTYTRYALYDSNWPALVKMGWEYEIDNPKITNSNLWIAEKEKIQKVLGTDFTFCRDGGHYDQITRIMTSGIEVRSPVGPLFLAKHWAKQLIPFTRKCKDHNGPNNNGGIHVNISKNKFTQKHWNKVRVFLHNPQYFDILLKLSDRSTRSFSHNAPQGFHTTKYGIITSQKKYAYELRMFGAHTDTFLPSLDFADALFRYAATVDEIKPDEFFTWVDARPKYNDLSKYIHFKLS